MKVKHGFTSCDQIGIFLMNKYLIYLSLVTAFMTVTNISHARNLDELMSGESEAIYIGGERQRGNIYKCYYEVSTINYGYHTFTVSFMKGCLRSLAYTAISPKIGIARIIGTSNGTNVRVLK